MVVVDGLEAGVVDLAPVLAGLVVAGPGTPGIGAQVIEAFERREVCAEGRAIGEK